MQAYRPLESSVESKCSRYAETRGWFEIKVEKASKRGFPDHIFVRKGRVVFVEFKRDENEEPVPQQLKRHKELREHGAEVLVVNSIEDFKIAFR